MMLCHCVCSAVPCGCSNLHIEPYEVASARVHLSVVMLAAAFLRLSLHCLADKSNVGVGYDLGAQNVFASISGDTNVSNKPISAKAIWFQRGNAVRTEADVKLDHRQKLWGT